MNITAAQVKELREKTGVGMMDCKKALAENNGDMDAAVDWLRTKGLAKAAKKAGRAATEGLVGVLATGHEAAIAEVNSETDFVARNDQFQDLVTTIASIILQTDGTLDAVLAADYPGSGKNVADEMVSAVATIGENMTLRRVEKLSVDQGAIGAYVHGAVKDGLGKIGVLVALESDGPADKLEALGKQIAMHIAATNPLALNEDELDPDVIERERNVHIEQARESGKPEDIIEKMIVGRMRKFFEEVTLLKQTFVIDGENTIEQVLANASKEFGTEVRLSRFVRFGVGEGIEKEESNFADEVAAVSGVSNS